MIIMYSLTSLPLIYVYSFSPKSELVGFVNFFIINVVACFLDMILAFLALFSQGSSSTTVVRVSKLTSMTTIIRWVVAVLFPSVNFKRSLFDIRLKSSRDCINAVNSLMLTTYSYTERWTSLREPGLGIEFIIFCVQMCFWWIILTLVEKGDRIKLGCRQCCGLDDDLKQVDGQNQWDNEDGAVATAPNQWNDAVC